jgi:hypothetical protein
MDAERHIVIDGGSSRPLRFWRPRRPIRTRQALVPPGTYHRAKGIEFKRLFLPGLDDSYPRGQLDDPDELIEAGSLRDVAMSRARDELDISYAGQPSMFLDGLLPHLELVTAEVAPT